jgi:hypothetical protein
VTTSPDIGKRSSTDSFFGMRLQSSGLCCFAEITASRHFDAVGVTVSGSPPNRVAKEPRLTVPWLPYRVEAPER